MIGDFHFLRPWWLLGVVFAIALWRLAARRSDMRTRWRDMIAPHLLDHLMVAGTSAGRFRPYHLTALLLAVGSLAAAGPTWDRERPPFVEDDAPLAVAVDLSPTMDAIDVTPSRLERAKLKIHDILRLRPAGRTALIAYAGTAHLVLPLTDDASLISTYADALATRIMPVAGRDMPKALALADGLLAAEPSAGSVLFLTDGIDPAAIETIAGRSGRNNVIVLGIGTPEGGPVKTADGGFLADSAGARVFARLDVEAFKTLRDKTNADVATVSADDSDMHWVAARIRSHFEQQRAEGNLRWRDLGWWLVPPLALLAAFSFRRGWMLRWAGAILLAHVAFSGSPAGAADWRPVDAFLTPDQQGRRAFDHGDYAVAAAHFHDPMWLGAALYRAGKYAEAIDAFARVRSPESDYDQGNALMHLGKFEEAAASYRRALEKRSDWPAARHNLAIAEKLAARQKQDDEEQPQDPNEKPDQVQFDDKGKKGKAGEVDLAEQTSELWMKNIVISPADLLARKFAIEVGEARK
jgi:Ca-activated chloride channel family protein